MADEFRAQLEAAKAEVELLHSSPYDGIAGDPPDWLPAALCTEFSAIRQRLLNSHTLSEVRHALEEVRQYQRVRAEHAQEVITSEQGYSTRLLRLPMLEPNVMRDLEALLYIQSIASLDLQAGIRAHLGESVVPVVRGIFLSDENREKAKKPRPRIGSAEIDEILKRNPDASEKEVGKELEKRGLEVNWRTLKDRVYRRRKQMKLR